MAVSRLASTYNKASIVARAGKFASGFATTGVQVVVETRLASGSGGGIGGGERYSMRARQYSSKREHEEVGNKLHVGAVIGTGLFGKGLSSTKISASFGRFLLSLYAV